MVSHLLLGTLLCLIVGGGISRRGDGVRRKLDGVVDSVLLDKGCEVLVRELTHE